MPDETKPTRDECIRAAAPHLAALVLEGRARDSANDSEPPTGGTQEQHTQPGGQG